MSQRREQTLVSSTSAAPRSPFQLSFMGGASVTVFRGDGRIETREGVPNQNTAVGRNFLAAWISSYATGVNSQMSHIAIGVGTTPVSANQTVLVAERVRKAFAQVTVSTNCWTVVATFGGGSDNIAGVLMTEAGISNDPRSAQGVLWNRLLLATNTFTLQNSDIASVKMWTVVGTG